MAAKSLSHEFTPRGAALALMTDHSPEVVCAGPAGTGKSHAGLMKGHLCLIGKPGVSALLVRKTAVSLTSTTLVTWKKTVAAEAIKAGLCAWYGGSSEEAAGYRYTNGSRLTVGGMDKPEKIMSSEYDLIIADEATELTIDDWEMASSRLRNGVLSYQQIIALCNPSRPTHWLKARCDTGAAKMLTSRHEDNPRYFTADGQPTEEGATYMARLDALTGVRRLRLRLGIWAAADGLIYEEFDDTIHIAPPFKVNGLKSGLPPLDWPRYLSIDFGFTNPFVCQWWAEDPDGGLHLYREIYMTRRLVEDHARIILDIQKRTGDKTPEWIVTDHDAEDRATFTKHLGQGTRPARKTVKPGIQAVKSRLQVSANGKPRITLHRDSVVQRDTALADAKKPCSTIEEITGYVWKPEGSGKVPEEPVKEDDHGMDAMRYVVAELDLRMVPRVRIAGR